MAVSTRQAAQRLGVTERQVQRYVRAGLLEAQQFGDYTTAPWMITNDSLERLLVLRTAQPERFRRRSKPAPSIANTEGA